MKKRWYMGTLVHDYFVRETFQSTQKIEDMRMLAYSSIIGPFRTKLGAEWAARNPYATFYSIREAERKARE